MSKLLILQSLWSMERLRGRPEALPLETSIKMIKEAGFDGIAAPWTSREAAARVAREAKAAGLIVEGGVFPGPISVDELKPILEWGTEFGVHHINVQPGAPGRRLAECLPIFEGWSRLAEEVDFAVNIETHRDRTTNDMFLTLDLIEAFPAIRLTADLSHYVVGREMGLPLSPLNAEAIGKVLDHTFAFHGRVSNGEQVQVELSFPQHHAWVEQFKAWWAEGFANWQARSAPDAELTFLCELGPAPYAITGRDGADLVDRWEESLQLRDMVRSLWEQVQQRRGAE